MDDLAPLDSATKIARLQEAIEVLKDYPVEKLADRGNFEDRQGNCCPATVLALHFGCVTKNGMDTRKLSRLFAEEPEVALCSCGTTHYQRTEDFTWRRIITPYDTAVRGPEGIEKHYTDEEKEIARQAVILSLQAELEFAR